MLQYPMRFDRASIRQQNPAATQALTDDALMIVAYTEHVGCKKSCDMFHLKLTSISVHLIEK